VAAAFVVAAIAVGVWELRADRPPRLIWPNNGAFGVAIPFSSDPRPWSFGAIPLCLDKPGHIVVDRLVPLGGSGGLSVVDVATRPHVGVSEGVGETLFGNSQRDLGAEGFAITRPAVVDAVCPPSLTTSYPGRVIYDELGVQVRRTAGGNGEFRSVRLDYTSNGHHEHITIAWSLKLCGPQARTNEACGST
jgi:hypothetical protein